MFSKPKEKDIFLPCLPSNSYLFKKLVLRIKMASKRSMKENTIENLSKQIKLEQKLISEKIGKDFPDMDIHEHKINKFILIFPTLLNASLKDYKLSKLKALDSEDGIQDTI